MSFEFQPIGLLQEREGRQKEQAACQLQGAQREGKSKKKDCPFWMLQGVLFLSNG